MGGHRLRIGLLAGIAITASTAAFAQDATAQPPADDGGLQDIVVTAQRRAQTLQEVPVAVSVMDATTIADQRISSIEGLTTAVPNLVVTRSPYQPVIAIRGLGSGGGSRAFEQSVATYVDGVYAGRANQFMNPFFDVERVEIVRGPQSVLFGVNAIAGAINIVNKKPGDHLEGYATAGWEAAYNGYNVEGGLTVPLTDTLSVRAAGKINRDGGFLHNNVTGKDEPETNSRIGRITLSWRPTGDLRFDLAYEHAYKKIDGSAFQTTYLPFAVFPPEIEDGKLDFDKSSPGTPDFTRLKTDNITLNGNSDMGGMNLSSTTAYSHYSFDQALPAGAVPVFLGTALDDETFEQIFQEFRLASTGRNMIDYIFGVSYYHQKSVIDQGIDYDFTAFGFPGMRVGARNALDQKTDAISVFGQGTVNFTDDLNLVVGGRFSSITKKADYFLSTSAFGAPLSGYAFDPGAMQFLHGIGYYSYIDPANPATLRPLHLNRKRTFDNVNPSVSLNYKFTPELSAYASFTTGTKAGGFNDQEKTGITPETGFAQDAFSYNSEKAHNFEIGVKGGGRTLRFNFAAFYTKYKNLQASQVLANGSLFTTNAASATAKGVEGDITWRIVPSLTFSADAAYIHARYDDYPGAGCIVTLEPSTCVPSETNARGGRLDGVPAFAGSLNLMHEMDVGGGWDLRTRGRVYYNDGSQFQSNQDPLDRVPSYTFIDASMTLANRGNGLSLSVSGKNLTNKLARGYSGPAASPLFGHQSLTLPGRQVYLDVRFDF